MPDHQCQHQLVTLMSTWAALRSALVGVTLRACQVPQLADNLGARAMHQFPCLSKFLSSCQVVICGLCRQQMIDSLAAGVTLIVDRYAYSGVAFTAAQLPSPDPRGLDLDWCKVSLLLE